MLPTIIFLVAEKRRHLHFLTVFWSAYGSGRIYQALDGRLVSCLSFVILKHAFAELGRIFSTNSEALGGYIPTTNLVITRARATTSHA